MPSHPSIENKASTDEAFGSKVLSGAGVSWIQRINIHDFTISDAVCARIYKIGLETNTYSERFFANYQLHLIPTSLATRALFFFSFSLDAKLI